MQLKTARKAKGWTQAEVSRRLQVTQAYISMMERGQRPASPRVLRRTLRVLALPPTALPLPEVAAPVVYSQQFFAEQLAALGYPGFAYLRFAYLRGGGGGRRVRLNPAELLLSMLMGDQLESRLVEALPWLPYRYAEMDWDWLVKQAKLHDVQNRLGFVVHLARQLAERHGHLSPSPSAAATLARVLSTLGAARLAKEDTLCHASLTQAERRWLRVNRPPEAQEWNLLTDMKVEHLVHVD